MQPLVLGKPSCGGLSKPLMACTWLSFAPTVPEPLPLAEQEPGARHRRPHPERDAGPRPPLQVGGLMPLGGVR